MAQRDLAISRGLGNVWVFQKVAAGDTSRHLAVFPRSSWPTPVFLANSLMFGFTADRMKEPLVRNKMPNSQISNVFPFHRSTLSRKSLYGSSMSISSKKKEVMMNHGQVSLCRYLCSDSSFIVEHHVQCQLFSSARSI